MFPKESRKQATRGTASQKKWFASIAWLNEASINLGSPNVVALGSPKRHGFMAKLN